MQSLAAAAACALLAIPASAQRRAGAAPASATAQQGPTPIRVGQTVNGRLTAASPRLTEKGAFRVYRFDGRKGQKLIATMRSADFDTYLTVARTVSGITDAIASDDDHGGGEKGTDSRVRFTVPADGSYLLVAQALDTTGTGAYTLALETAPTPTTAVAQPIRIGQTVNGTLAETDAVLEDDDTYYDTYTLSLQRGQRVAIEMRADSNGIDPFLNVGRMAGGEFSSIKTDDDGAGGLNSRVVLTADETGEYVIRANEVGAKTGPYTLSVTERHPGPTTATPHPIEPNTEVQGKLDDDDPQDSTDQSYFDYWTYQAHAGERVTITMKSDAFDTFVAVGTLDGTAFHELDSNDDGDNMGTNSQLTYTFANAGTYVIRAKALQGESQGPYTLKVEPAH
jgi:hypothetical protein